MAPGLGGKGVIRTLSECDGVVMADGNDAVAIPEISVQ